MFISYITLFIDFHFEEIFFVNRKKFIVSYRKSIFELETHITYGIILRFSHNIEEEYTRTILNTIKNHIHTIIYTVYEEITTNHVDLITSICNELGLNLIVE